MKSLFKFSVLVFSAVIIISCSKSNEHKPLPKIELQSNKDSIVKSASGQYSGMIPCADCEGIKYTIILQPSMTFSSKSVYVGKKVPPLETSGNWSMIGDSIIFLQSNDDVPSFMRLYYNDSLVMLDKSKNRMNGPLAGMFVLHKVKERKTEDSTSVNTSEIPAINFILEEINGKKVVAGDFNTTPEIMINAGNGSAQGSTGCNRFNGNVKITKDEISFGDFAMTRMNCPGNGEQNFIAALKSANTYKIENGKLILMDKDKNVAVFTKK